ncbi:MAG: DUF4337 family protein [Sphingomonadales bacterium]|nr:DUF4337 family protein [Sphingomonadales bacterium]
MEPAETRDPVTAAPAGTLAERRFGDHAALLVGVFAVLLAIVHLLAAAAARDSLLASIEASDSFAYMQAKVVRETVLLTASRMPGLESETRANELGEAVRLRQPDARGHGIDQLEDEGTRLRRRSTDLARASANYGLAESALQLAILLLAVAMAMNSARALRIAAAVAGGGVLVALLTLIGVRLL